MFCLNPVDVFFKLDGLVLNFLELYPDSVFRFGIGWYFPGIFPTDTKGKLGRDVSVLYIWREPLFFLKGRILPPF
jgi:hypothetical protein